MKNTLAIMAVALGLAAFSPPVHAFIPGLENIDIGVGVELGYGVRELESIPPRDLRNAESIATTGSIKLAVETVEKFNVFLALGMAEVNVFYIESIEKIEVIGEDGKLVELGFRWCVPITGDSTDGMRVGISYKYQTIISDIEKRIKGNVIEFLHPESEIKIKYHEGSLFLSEWLDFLTLYVGARYSDILKMEITEPGKPTLTFAPKEKAGIVIGADIPLGDLLADIIPLPVDINLNFEVEALHEASIRFGGSIVF